LQQDIFFFDQIGRPALVDHNAETLRYAIRTAHRFVFSQRSLRILYCFYGYGSFYDSRAHPQSMPALGALVGCDGMSVVLDCNISSSGRVRKKDPWVLRINATVSFPALIRGSQLMGIASQTSIASA
jgi:hypothetical protein